MQQPSLNTPLVHSLDVIDLNPTCLVIKVEQGDLHSNARTTPRLAGQDTAQ